MRTTSYWKFGGGYSYRTPGSKKTGWSKTLAGVPKSAKGPGSTKKKARKSSPKKKGGKKRVTKKKKGKGKGGFRLPGGLGPKGILTGALGLAVVPRFLPVASPGAKMAGTGLALRALKLGGGGALTSAGLIMMAGEFIAPYIGGFIGGNSGTTSRGGYDY